MTLEGREWMVPNFLVELRLLPLSLLDILVYTRAKQGMVMHPELSEEDAEEVVHLFLVVPQVLLPSGTSCIYFHFER